MGVVVETGMRLRDLLVAEGLGCWPKTTGGKGLHVMVPIERYMTWDAAHAFTREVAERLAQSAPDRYATSPLVPRAGKLFIVYLRNGRGTTAVGAYSPRARPGFPVAAPVTGVRLSTGCGRMRSASGSRREPAPLDPHDDPERLLIAAKWTAPILPKRPTSTQALLEFFGDQDIRWGLDHNQSIEQIADFCAGRRQSIGRLQP